MRDLPGEGDVRDHSLCCCYHQGKTPLFPQLHRETSQDLQDPVQRKVQEPQGVQNLLREKVPKDPIPNLPKRACTERTNTSVNAAQLKANFSLSPTEMPHSLQEEVQGRLQLRVKVRKRPARGVFRFLQQLFGSIWRTRNRYINDV